MKSFSFKSTFDENQNVERIITERNRKLARQQVIFALLLALLLLLLCWYIFRKVIYTEFDGYVQTEYIDHRAIEDIYLFDHYTAVGDIVMPGDTLYSFLYVNLFGIGNLESEPTVIVNDRNARLQLNMAYADAEVLRVRIRELENQIAREDNNIRFGLTDNSHKMDLQRQLAEAREELNTVIRKAHLYGDAHRESHEAAQRFGRYSLDFANEQWGLDESLRQLYDRNSSAIRYAVAQDTAIVTKLWAAPFSRVFKKEHILQLENLSFDDSNVQVVAYVPTGDMHNINNNTHAEIIVNDYVSFTATVQLLGARTEDLPEELRNSLSHNYTTVMVVFKPDPDQVLPLWAVVDRVPVKVRINNFDNGRRDDGSDYWYINQTGLTEESRYYLGLTRNRRGTGHIHYDPKQNEEANNSAATETAKPAEQPEAAKSEETVKSTEPEEKAAEPEKKTDTVNVKYIRHKVVKGETLYSLSKKYEVSVKKIVEHNPGVEKKLVAGKMVNIPDTKAE